MLLGSLSIALIFLFSPTGSGQDVAAAPNGEMETELRYTREQVRKRFLEIVVA